jgi:hypothetical protein
MRVNKNTLLLLIAAVLAPFLYIAPALAATNATAPTEGISLQISPLPIQLNAKPGSSVGTDLRVRNAGTQDEKLQVRLLKVSADNSGGVHLTNPSSSDEFVSWVHFSKNVFDAPPGEWQDIKMTVSVPKTAAFGYYFAVEYLRANAEQAQPGKAVARGAVATFILLNADAPGATRQAQIVSFSADKKSYEFLPVNFTVKVRSSGNVHVAPHGNIFILHGKKQVGSIQVNSAEGNILPGSSRFFEAGWSDGFPVPAAKYNGDTPVLDKSGRPEYSYKWDFSKANRLRFGHYTAHLVLVYDNGQRDVPMEAYVSFWVIPWRIAGIVLGILVLIAGLIAYVIILRRRLKRASQSARAKHD